MQVETWGLDSAPLIPLGATVTKAYWQVPGHYGSGENFETKDLALTYAIDNLRADIARHVGRKRSHPVAPLPENVTVDYRWELTSPGTGGSLDLVVQRNMYPTLADTEEALSLYNQFNLKE